MLILKAGSVREVSIFIYTRMLQAVVLLIIFTRIELFRVYILGCLYSIRCLLHLY